MKQAEDLRRLLESIDHKSYPAYKSAQGAYAFNGYILSIDHVQGDPFAAPSRLSVHVAGRKAAFPVEYYDTYAKRITLQDHLTRLFGAQLAKGSMQAKGSGKSGLLAALFERIQPDCAHGPDAKGARAVHLRTERCFPRSACPWGKRAKL